ncbi:hypothetical protein [Nonomuraea soli]|uniref:Uncharacterized protein n=1 Tax=Nonomuraea soli TaxID=1032476 RepID=A0A7W0CTB1_9ACTN|nr:hypothetical protein [Nonomuraea soli]MBA2896789.1 hypothetical protein [Nonomuraea soli]
MTSDKSREIQEWALRNIDPAREPGRPGPPLDERMAELPPAWHGVGFARDHLVRITNPFQEPASTPAMPPGLAAAVPDCVVIRTLRATGPVNLWADWQQDPWQLRRSAWPESEELEFVTTTGIMRPLGAEFELNLTFQGAGRYALRVYGRQRPRTDQEGYFLHIRPITLGAAALG